MKGETRLLSALVPQRGYFPDFLTPAEGSEGLDTGLEALRATSPARLHTEVALAAAHPSPLRSLPGRLASLAEGRAESVARLVAALRAYYHAAVEPYWTHIQAQTRTASPDTLAELVQAWLLGADNLARRIERSEKGAA